MASLTYWDDNGGSWKPFLTVSVGETDGEERVWIHYTFRHDYNAEVSRASYLCDNNDSYEWLLYLAGALQRAEEVDPAASHLKSAMNVKWNAVMWQRTDSLTALVIGGSSKSHKDLCWVQFFLRPDENSNLHHFFVVCPTYESLRKFGKELFQDLLAVPGFDQESKEWCREQWNQ